MALITGGRPDIMISTMACSTVNIIGLGILAFAVFVAMWVVRKEFPALGFRLLRYFSLFVAVFYTVHQNIGSCVYDKVYFSLLPTEWDLAGVIVFFVKLFGLG